MTIAEQNERIRQGWECHRGKARVHKPIEPPVFAGHPRFARAFSYEIAIFVLRVFHNRETEFYADASQAIIDNARFYIENTDVRDDRDSFYWNIGELCRAMLRYGSHGTDEPGLITPEAEEAFLEMALGYCHDNSRLTDAEWEGMATWRIYESENHHVQKNSALWQMELILSRWGKGSEILGDGATVDEHFARWSEFFAEWMRQRATHSMFVEIHSKCYGVHTMKNIYPLYDFAPDEKLRRLTGDFITLFWALWAQEQLCGIHGGGQSRIYPGSALNTGSENAHWAWYYCGIGSFTPPGGMAYVMMDCSWRMPKMIQKMILCPEERGRYTVESRPFGRSAPDNRFPDYRFNTEWGHIYRYTVCTPDYIFGTLMCPQLTQKDWCAISSQNRFQGVTFRVPGAVLALLPLPTGMHNLHSTVPEIAYNAFWSMMRDTTLLTQRCLEHKGPMRVWFSKAGELQQSILQRDGWILTRCGDVYAAIRVGRGGYHFEENEKPAGCWLFCDDGSSPVILEAGDVQTHGSFEQFADAVCALAPEWDGAVMRYHSLSGHDFVMITDADGNSTIDGEYYVKKIDASARSPFVNCAWNGDKAEITFGGEQMTLDFRA